MSINRVIGISGISDLVKTLMELIGYLTPVVNFGEVQRPLLAKSSGVRKATLVPAFGQNCNLVPAFVVKDLPLGTTLV